MFPPRSGPLPSPVIDTAHHGRMAEWLVARLEKRCPLSVQSLAVLIVSESSPCSLLRPLRQARRVRRDHLTFSIRTFFLHLDARVCPGEQLMSNRVSSARVIVLPAVILAILATAAIVWFVYGGRNDQVASRHMERERPLGLDSPVYSSTLQPLASGYTKMDVRLRGVPCKGDTYIQRLHNLRSNEQVLL